jgi:hypothetical protein
MQACRQNEHQTIHEHGLSVARHYTDLIEGRTAGWKLPSWWIKHRDRLLADQPSVDLMATYHEFHDCGKPFCRTVDEDGRQHFPNHATVSASVWRVHCPEADPLIGDLIQHDMDLHLLKPSTIDTFTRYDLAPALLLTALSELHSNAAMFGGIESTSFCIKLKTLAKTGTLICNRLYGA